MSKRCCANNCFNSLLSNKKVEYFGIPRHEGFAKAWCVAAGREDLLEKPLNNIIKYHICSEHFTDDCFKDPKERKMLKKTSRPVNVPIPTIFKNNIDQFLHKNNDNSEQYNTGSILNSNNHKTLSQLSSIDHSIERDLSISASAIQILDDECMYLGKSQEYDIDGIEAYCLSTNTEGPIQIYRNNDVEFMMEERLEDDEQVDDIYDEYEDDVKRSVCEIPEKHFYYENICRLCAEVQQSGSSMIEIFTSSTNMEHLLEHINKLLPKPILQDDGLPQKLCLRCYSKLETFCQTLGFFISAQERFQH